MTGKDKDLWAPVRAAREQLRDHENFPVLDSLEKSWQTLVEHDLAPPDDRYGETWSDTPLSELMFLVEMGFYPPPELLLGLADAWHEYLVGSGKVSLEEVFLGKPNRRSGNYASRNASYLNSVHTGFSVQSIRRQHRVSLERAVEMYLEQNPDNKMQVESVIKMIQRRKAKQRGDKKAR